MATTTRTAILRIQEQGANEMETTDSERAAVTILSRAHPTHPVLQTWIWHIARDASFQASIEDITEDHYQAMIGHRGDGEGYPDAYVDPDLTLANTLRVGEYPRPTDGEGWLGLLLRERAHSFTLHEGDTVARLGFIRMMDDALARLAVAVVEFRQAGRSTSLAAVLADYVERVADAYAARMRVMSVSG